MQARARLLLLLLASTLLVSAVWPGRMEPSVASTPLQLTSRPNVLIVVTDDQRKGTLRVMPATRAWFRAAGMSFSRAYATTPLCCPSRASILTGRFAHNHRLLTNVQGHLGVTDADSEFQRSTLQRYLQQAGYRTAIYGKYLNGWPLEIDPPYFDQWAIIRGAYRDYPANIDGTLVTVPTYYTSFVRRRAVRFLEQQELDDERPWFLYLAVKAPHSPYTTTRRYESAPVGRWEGNPAVFEVDRSDKPAYVQGREASPRRIRRVRAGQLRALMPVDDMVARLRQVLEGLDEDEDTLAFFVSDNGYVWGEHGLVSHKRVPYLQSVAIPLLMRWPGRVPAGVNDRRLAGALDIAAAVLDAAGLDPEHPLDGRSLLRPTSRDRLLLEYWRSYGNIPSWGATLTDGYQYVEYYDAGGSVTFREYYDLVEDPWQLTNLLGNGLPGDDPDVSTLAERLAADRTCAGTDGPSACP